MEAASYVPVPVGCPARRGSVYVTALVPAKDKGVNERSTGLSNMIFSYKASRGNLIYDS